MNPRKLFIPLLYALLFSVAAMAQDSSFIKTVLSEPTDLPTTGWNKTCLMHDGRTFVLHLAAWEKMYVKVYDTAHKEIVSVRQMFKVISEHQLFDTDFWGPYDIGGWPTLFAQQLMNGEEGLVRVQFDPNTGAIHDETIMYSSKFETYCLSKSEQSDDYAVYHLRSPKNPAFNRVLKVSYWNGKHVRTKVASFTFPTSDYITANHLGFYYDADYGTSIAMSYVVLVDKSNYEQYIWTGHLQGGDSVGQTNIVKMPKFFNPKFGLFQYNLFAGAINLNVTGNVIGKIHEGLWDKPVDYYTSFLITFDMSGREVKSFHQLFNRKASDYLQNNSDTGHHFAGIPFDMYTNKYGITSMICHNRIGQTESIDGERHSYPGLSLTRFDDQGEELSGMVLPKANFPPYTSNVNEVMSRQMSHVSYIPGAKDQYVFFNDNAVNFSSTCRDSLQVIKAFDNNEAMCYHISSKDKVDKAYIFGKPAGDESRSLITGSLDRQPDGKQISSLVLIKKGKEKHLCVAWCKLQ